jgi:hypothetical protein
MAPSTVAVLEPLAHRTLSGAHRTVRCPHLTVGSAMCHARIVRATVGQADRWLTGQSGAPPDSPVTYSRTPPASPESGLFTRVQPGAPDTVRCTIGHCLVHQTELKLTAHSQHHSFSFLLLFFLFPALRQTMLVHKNDDLGLETYLVPIFALYPILAFCTF